MQPARGGQRAFATSVGAEAIQVAVDPMGKMLDDTTSMAQAQAIMGADDNALPDLEGTNLRRVFFCTLNDTKLYDVPWPSDYEREESHV